MTQRDPFRARITEGGGGSHAAKAEVGSRLASHYFIGEALDEQYAVLTRTRVTVSW